MLGMHRSGTSALTRTLNLLGAALPVDLMPPAPDNVLGFWESQRLMETHERILGAAGTSWDGLESIPPRWFETDTAADFRGELLAFIASEFESAELLVLKDPRISLFTPLWFDVLRELEVEPLPVLMLRNPLEVAGSLARRNSFSKSRSCFLWLRYMLEAEAGTRATRRSLIRFDALLDDWQRQARRVFEDLGLSWHSVPAETALAIEEFLAPEQRHHSASRDDLRADPAIAGWVADSYDLLLRLIDEPHSVEALRNLDTLRAHFGSAARIYLPLLTEREAADQESSAQQVQELARLGRVLGRQADQLRGEVVEHLKSQLSEVTDRLRHTESTLQKAEGEKAQLVGELRRTLHLLDRWVRRSGQLALGLRAAVSDPFRLARTLVHRAKVVGKWIGKLTGPDLETRHLYRAIGESGLFDPEYYARQVGAADPSGVNLLRHFIRVGSHGGLRPNPLFDPAFYLRNYPDVARVGMDPLGHFIKFGAAEGRAPHPLVDTRFYLELYPEVASSGENPLAHYLRVGDHEPRWTHPLFDPEFYRAEYPDVARYNINPLVHYLHYGRSQPLRPNPEFDPVRYLEQHPDLDRRTATPLEHFAEFGPWSAAQASLRHFKPPEAGGADSSGEQTAIGWRRLADPTAIDRNAKLNELLNGFQKVVSGRPIASVVIPVFNQIDYTVHCLWSLCHFRHRTPFEVIVVDDQSTDETREVLALVPGLTVVETEEQSGFVGACNRGAAQARGRFIVFLNNDTAVLDDWLDELVDTFARVPDAGYASSKLLYPDRTLQEAGCVVWSDGSAWNIGRNGDPGRPEYNYLRDTHYGSGCSLMTPTEVFRDLGGFAPELKPGYYEDIDYAYRVRADGKRVLYQPASQLIHFEGRTGGTDVTAGPKKHQLLNREKFKKRWAQALATETPETVPLYRVDCKGASAHVLFIEPTTLTPDRDAGSAMSFNLIRALARLRMKVTFIPSENFLFESRYTRLLQREGVECLYRPYYDSLDDVFRARPDAWDYIFIARLHCIAEVFDEVRAANPSAKFIYQTIDLSFVRERRELELGLFSGRTEDVDEREEAELEYIRACHKSIIVSTFERDLLASRGLGDKVVSMPLLSYDYPPPELGSRRGVMFIGGFRHRPNVDAVRFLAEEIVPAVTAVEPDLVFYIVGGDVPDELKELASPNLLFMGQIQNPDRFFLSMRLSIAPLRYGAGIKGKVIQSLAAGLPCVGTALAAEGIGGAEETGLWVDDTAEGLARGVIELTRDDDAWRRAADLGYRFARRLYSPEALQRDVERFVRDALDGGDAR